MWWSTQPTHGLDAAAFRAIDQDALRRYLRYCHAGWHDPFPRLVESVGDILVTATLDVATLPTWSRRRTILIGDAAHATSPHAGQGASLALEDAMRLSRSLGRRGELGEAFAAFERERRPRAERIVALAHRNGNNKRQSSPAGAWIRDRMLKILIPVSARGLDWIYGYDPRTA
jgi:2-polyprenyl-6-methoxyphenol hydroxylase-like FAD-dependent oxidoreductase